MDLPRWIAVGAVAAGVFAARPASAWQEAHEASDDVHVTVEPSGVAHVEHAIGYRIVRGPLRGFDLSGIETNAIPESTASITSEDGAELTASVVAHGERAFRVAVDEPRALMRGNFVFHLRYTVDLLAAGELTRDGSMWRLAWTAPVAVEGFDGGHATFELPAAPEAPEPVRDDTGDVDSSILGSLRREADRDVLELVRPHVARGEQVAWTLRLDPHAFADAAGPVAKPVLPDRPQPPPDRIREASLGAGLFAIGLVYALLVAHKDRRFRALREARGYGATGRSVLGLFRLSAGWRGALAGAFLAGGVGLELWDLPTAGAGVVSAAMLLAIVPVPKVRVPARGPGLWTSLRPETAFGSAREMGEPLDIGCALGRITALVLLAAAVALAVAVRHVTAQAPYLVMLDFLALLPVFLTGRATQLPPSRSRACVPFLRAVYRRLASRQAIRVVPWGRVPAGREEPDELRLLALPRAPMPGLLGVEAGLAWGRTASGYAGMPELLARVEDRSVAADRMVALAPGVRPVPGRRPEERVFRITPELGTRAGTSRLLADLLEGLRDRRVTVVPRTEPWAGLERRRAA